jgi:putative MATE family efflux protein
LADGAAKTTGARRGGRSRANLTEGPVSKQLFDLAAPMVVGMASVMLFNLVDTWFVSRLGTLPLAAMSFTFPVITLVGSFTMGLGIGTSSVLSRMIGAGDEEGVRRTATDALILAVVLVASLATLGWLTIDPVFTALGADPETLGYVREYMRIWYVGMVFLVVPMVGNAAIRATGDTKTPAMVMVLAGATNALLDPILIFGFGPIPGMGMAGAAIATVCGRAITLVVALWVLTHREAMIVWARVGLQQLLRSWRAVLAVGLPAGATNVVVPASVAILTWLIAQHGPEAVAAFGAASRIEMMALLAMMALGSGLGPFVGQNWGAGKVERVAEALSLSNRFALAWGAASFVGLGLSSALVADLFVDDEQVANLMAQILWLLPAGHAFHGLFFIGTSTFNAMGRPLFATVLSVLRTPVLLLAFAFAGRALFGLPGIFGAVAAANLVVGVLAAVWTRHATRGA